MKGQMEKNMETVNGTGRICGVCKVDARNPAWPPEPYALESTLF